MSPPLSLCRSAPCVVRFGVQRAPTPCSMVAAPGGQEGWEASPPDGKHQEVPCRDIQSGGLLEGREGMRLGLLWVLPACASAWPIHSFPFLSFLLPFPHSYLCPLLVAPIALKEGATHPPLPLSCALGHCSRTPQELLWRFQWGSCWGLDPTESAATQEQGLGRELLLLLGPRWL